MAPSKVVVLQLPELMRYIELKRGNPILTWPKELEDEEFVAFKEMNKLTDEE